MSTATRSLKPLAACAVALAGCVLGGVEGEFVPLEIPSEPAATCHDGALNGSERDVDCGGGCSPCGEGQACREHSDCASGLCAGAACAPASCTDGALDGGESDVDCGGPCPGCADGAVCLENGDCESGVCSGGACAPARCGDGVHNGGESDVDCGGGCAPCGPGMACTGHGDCAGGVCLGGQCAPTCSDAVLNQSETDVDCGGTICPACSPGSDCLVPNDCTSHVCTAGLCQNSTCSDGNKSGLETDVDCGGPDCAPCANGDDCIYGEDCLSGGCSAGVCGRWVKTFASGDYGSLTNGDVAFDTSGNVIFATPSNGAPVDYGGGPVAQYALVKYAPAGVHVWSRSLPYCAYGPLPVATTSAGDVVIAGSFAGVFDLGCGSTVVAASDDLVIAQFSSPDGSCSWQQRYDNPGSELVPSLAVTPNGDLVVTGHFNGPTFTFGNDTLVNPATPAFVTFVARVDATGSPIWARAFGAPTIVLGVGAVVVATPGNDVLFGGYFKGTIDFAPPCTSYTSDPGFWDGFVAKLDGATGACLWSRRFDSGQSDVLMPGGLGSDASGNAIVAGAAIGDVDFGNGPVSTLYSLFVGKYAASNGAHVWSMVAGDAVAIDHSRIALAVDAAGHVHVTGRFRGPLNLGGNTLPFPGLYPVFVAKFSGTSGAHLYSTSFAGPGDSTALSVAVSPATGSVMAMGTYTGVADFGTGPITAANPRSTYLLSLGPVP